MATFGRTKDAKGEESEMRCRENFHKVSYCFGPIIHQIQNSKSPARYSYASPLGNSHPLKECDPLMKVKDQACTAMCALACE